MLNEMIGANCYCEDTWPCPVCGRYIRGYWDEYWCPYCGPNLSSLNYKQLIEITNRVDIIEKLLEEKTQLDEE